jgi:hypothetical protein
VKYVPSSNSNWGIEVWVWKGSLKSYSNTGFTFTLNTGTDVACGSFNPNQVNPTVKYYLFQQMV